MFSVRQKRKIAEAVQTALRQTSHPELPPGEIKFLLHVDGAEAWSWADIHNNGEALVDYGKASQSFQEASGKVIVAHAAGVAAGREAQRREDAEIARAKEEWASRNIINSRSSTDGDDRWDVGYQHAAATIAAAILRGGKP